jgi:hypothetical protein
MQNTKNRVVTIMLTKRIFSHKKLWLNFLRGSAAASILRG